MTKFPKEFYWGAATSAHQVEGGNHNDWTEWEKEKSKIKNQNAKLRKWPDYILNPPAGGPNPLQEENYISGRACDHYRRFQDDFDIAKSLGHNAHRFSVEWSRIEPEEGKFSEKEIEHYREVIKALRERGIEPFVTLWHWTLPLWVRDQGGWNSSKTIDDFVRYCRHIARALPDVRYWVVLNEPGSWAAHAYLFGLYPPQRMNIFMLARVYFHLRQAQRQSYLALKKINGALQVGISESMEWYRPFWARVLVNYLRNFYFLQKTKSYFDFVGLNYYRSRFLFGRGQKSDTGWRIYPEALYRFLKRAGALGKPVFVTENGIADARDGRRAEFIREHLHQIERALRDGVDVRGYFHWSLLDNFEWDFGFWPRFGLVEVDYSTQERRIRRSAYLYRDIIKLHEVGLHEVNEK